MARWANRDIRSRGLRCAWRWALLVGLAGATVLGGSLTGGANDSIRDGGAVQAAGEEGANDRYICALSDLCGKRDVQSLHCVGAGLDARTVDGTADKADASNARLGSCRYVVGGAPLDAPRAGLWTHLGSYLVAAKRSAYLAAVAAEAEARISPTATSRGRAAPDVSVGDVAGTEQGGLRKGVPTDEWAWLVCADPFTWPCEWALAVIDCESGGDPNAQGGEWYNGRWYNFNGLFQVVGGSFDPYTNAMEAHWKYHNEGVGAWPNCP